MKLNRFSLLYVESDFGTTDPQPTNHSQFSSPVEALNLTTGGPDVVVIYIRDSIALRFKPFKENV